jgi:hypothetical protein
MALGWGSWLLAVSAPVAKRVLTSLGFGVVTYVGMDAALSSALTAAKSAWGGMGADVASMVAMAGVNTAASILAGALTARLALEVAKRFMPLT